MSRTANQSARTRSNSTSRQASKFSLPEESISKLIKNSVPKGPVKIEDRLLNYQAQANRRLEVLKQSIEQEKLKELQTKPKILRKSRMLADIYDKKYFPPIHNQSDTEKLEKITEVPQSLEEKHEPMPQITVESVPFNTREQPVSRKRAKSVQTVSVIGKSKQSYNGKMENIDKRREINEQVINQYSFSINQAKKVMKKLETDNKYGKEEIMTPQSVETIADSVDHQKPSKTVQKSLTPFQVKISFGCGLDLEKFMKRASGENDERGLNN